MWKDVDKICTHFYIRIFVFSKKVYFPLRGNFCSQFQTCSDLYIIIFEFVHCMLYVIPLTPEAQCALKRFDLIQCGCVQTIYGWQCGLMRICINPHTDVDWTIRLQFASIQFGSVSKRDVWKWFGYARDTWSDNLDVTCYMWSFIIKKFISHLSYEMTLYIA